MVVFCSSLACLDKKYGLVFLTNTIGGHNDRSRSDYGGNLMNLNQNVNLHSGDLII